MKHIRIISPSGAIDPSYINGATARLRAWGYKVSEGAHARGRWGRFAGTDEERLADLNEALRDESVDMILCARGGYGLQRIIDRVAEIKKPIIGFSDITALHQLSGICHQPSLHGIMCKHIASLPEDSEENIKRKKRLGEMYGRKGYYYYHVKKLDEAMAAYEEALANASDKSDILTQMSQITLAEKNYEKYFIHRIKEIKNFIRL